MVHVFKPCSACSYVAELYTLDCSIPIPSCGASLIPRTGNKASYGTCL